MFERYGEDKTEGQTLRRVRKGEGSTNIDAVEEVYASEMSS